MALDERLANPAANDGRPLPTPAAVSRARGQAAERLDELATRIRAIDPLERRVTALEERVAALEKKPKPAASKKPAAQNPAAEKTES